LKGNIIASHIAGPTRTLGLKNKAGIYCMFDNIIVKTELRIKQGHRYGTSGPCPPLTEACAPLFGWL